MSEKTTQTSMICPCCGNAREISASECASCGARQVGEPLTPPDIILPKLGPAFVAFACAALVIIVFLSLWIVGNDMKVGRVMMVYLFGESIKLTKDLLQADPKLPYYRIFSYEGYRAAYMLSVAMIPLSIVGIWLARRAKRLAQNGSMRFGGLRLAKVSLAMSTAFLVFFSVAGATAIPNIIERSRAKRLAETRVRMYELHRLALQKYYDEYGSYPHELSDLSRVKAESVSPTDYWENNFNYVPVGVIASNGSAISLSNYKLVSAGPDGIFGTDDDIIMADGVIVSGKSDGEPPTTISTPEKPRQ